MVDEIVKRFNLDVSQVKIVQHCDFFKNDVSKMRKTDEGFLCGTAPVAKVGIMTYLMSDGKIVREFVPPETLFNKDSMASLKMKPVTNQHPPEKKVHSKNAAYRQVGYTGESLFEADNMLHCQMAITDQSAIDSIEKGRQELSPGYEAELVYQKGMFDNQEFDAIQVGRKYNHVAVVDSARGGVDIRMNFDGKEIISEKLDDNINKENVMKFKIDGIEYDAAQEVVNYIAKLDAQILENKNVVKLANDATQVATDSIQKITGERDALKLKVDELEKRDIKKEVNDAVQARLELERNANLVLDEVDQKLDDRSLKIAMITKKLPEIAKKIDDKTSVVYIDAVLDTILASVPKNDSISAQRKIVSNTDASTETNIDDVKSRNDMIKKQQDAYKRDNK